MSDSIEIDSVDRKIIHHLQKDSRKPYQEIAKDIHVSAGTVHVRFNKMKALGIVTGSSIKVDYEKLGLNVTAFVGVHLLSAGDCPKVLKKLEGFSEVTEVYYTTGSYGLFVKIMTTTTRELHLFLIEKIQAIPEVQSTETLISLDNPILREPGIS